MAEPHGTLRRELLTLVALVVVLDALFIGLYRPLGLDAAHGSKRVAYTVVWTALTLAIVLRGLSRIRRVRLERRRAR